MGIAWFNEARLLCVQVERFKGCHIVTGVLASSAPGTALELIDLRGVHGLTDTCVSKLCHVFHSRQAQNEAQP